MYSDHKSIGSNNNNKQGNGGVPRRKRLENDPSIRNFIHSSIHSRWTISYIIHPAQENGRIKLYNSNQTSLDQETEKQTEAYREMYKQAYRHTDRKRQTLKTRQLRGLNAQTSSGKMQGQMGQSGPPIITKNTKCIETRQREPYIIANRDRTLLQKHLQ